MKQIPLSRGLFALVDDTDFDFLSRWKWCASLQGKKGCVNPKYRAFRMEMLPNGKQRGVLMHRQIMGPNADEKIDHIDGNPLNNQRVNLRVTTQAVNTLNRVGWERKTSSRYKGVFWHKGGRKWMAAFRGTYLGLFVEEGDAAKAYNAAAMKHGGEIPLNAPGG